uniref:Disease resistance R13L4/SHOC-2-like LRR domain-containing protein n=1 Tax=Fagus sylvatica TaxID=28930 RepID=A0A2N9G7D9_FAGSY
MGQNFDLSSKKGLLQLTELSLTRLVRNLTSLENLDLTWVNISSTVPNIFANLFTLRSLHLKRCGMHGEFPIGIFMLPNLRVLNLNYNVDLIGSLPDFHNWSSPLEDLSLTVTSFSGELPASIGNLHSLIYLDLLQCNFSGNIPSSIGNLTNLMMLDLANNYLVGNIPSSIGNLIQLVYLDLYNNHLTGPIPSGLANLPELFFLQLTFNRLTGSIPSSIGNLTALESLDLSQNRLSGEIPPQLAQLTFLEWFNVSHNNLTGSIPQGKQLDTFENSSFVGNLGLCGNPLSKKCWVSDSSPPPPSISKQSRDLAGSLFEFGWKIVLVGYGFGLLVGVIIGNIVATRKHDWLMKTFGMKQRARRNVRREQRN